MGGNAPQGGSPFQADFLSKFQRIYIINIQRQIGQQNQKNRAPPGPPSHHPPTQPAGRRGGAAFSSVSGFQPGVGGLICPKQGAILTQKYLDSEGVSCLIEIQIFHYIRRSRLQYGARTGVILQDRNRTGILQQHRIRREPLCCAESYRIHEVSTGTLLHWRNSAQILL